MIPRYFYSWLNIVGVGTTVDPAAKCNQNKL